MPIYNYDVLSGVFDDVKFDVVIGNPPYQATKNDGDRLDQASNLWSVFWKKSIVDWSHDSSIVALITPTSWLSPSADLRGDTKIGKINRLWNYFETVSTYANVVDVKKYFDVGSTFGYAIVNKAGTDGLTFSDGSTTSLGFLPKSGLDEVIDQLDKNNNIGNSFKIVQENVDVLHVRVPITKTLKPDMIKIMNEKSDDNRNLDFNVIVNNMDEAKKVQAAIINAIPTLSIHCRWSGFLNFKTFEMVKYVA